MKKSVDKFHNERILVLIVVVLMIVITLFSFSDLSLSPKFFLNKNSNGLTKVGEEGKIIGEESAGGVLRGGSPQMCYVCNVSFLHAVVNHTAFNRCYGDADGNGFVNPGDRGFISVNVGTNYSDFKCLYDIDGNGFVNPGDRGFISVNVGLCTPLPDFQNGAGTNHGVADTRFPRCGDGIVQSSCEACDGNNLNGYTCANFGYGGGTLRCLNDCSDYSYVECVSQSCGNGIREGPEECDGNDFGELTCGSFGYGSGNLLCGSNCINIGLTQCTSPVLCGNGMINPFETCDDGNRLEGDGCSSVCVSEVLNYNNFERTYGYPQLYDEGWSGISAGQNQGYVYLESDGTMMKLVKTDSYGNSCGGNLHGILCNDSISFVRRIMQFPASTSASERYFKARKVLKTSDGGFVLAVETTGAEPNDWNPTSPTDGVDILLVKTDANGLTCNYFNSSTDGFCQGTSNGINVFARAIGGNGTERLIDLTQTQNGFLLALASDSFSVGGRAGVWLFRTSLNGQVCNYLQNGDCLDGNSFANYNDGLTSASFLSSGLSIRGGAVVDGNGSIYVVSGSNYLIKFSPTGSVCNYVPAVTECEDENSFVKKYSSISSKVELYDIDFVEDGLVIVGASNRDGSNNLHRILLLRTNFSGSTCTLNSVGSLDCSDTSSGNFVRHIDFSQDTSYIERGLFIKTLNDSFIIGAESDGVKNFGSRDVWILKTSRRGYVCDFFNFEGSCNEFVDGTNTFSRFFGGTAGDYIRGLNINENGFIISGYRENRHLNAHDSWLVSMNSDGNVDFSNSMGPAEFATLSPINGSTISTSNYVDLSVKIYNAPIGFVDFGGNRIRVYRISPNFDIVPYEVFLDATLKDYQLNEDVAFVNYEKMTLYNLAPNTTYTYRFILADAEENNIHNGGYSEAYLTFRTAA